MSLEDLTRYEYAGLALNSLSGSEENQKYIPGALEKLAENMGVNEDTRKYVNASLMSKEGIEYLVREFGKKYEDAKNSLSIGKLVSSYDGFLNGYLENQEDSAKIKEELDKYKDENFGSVRDKVVSAKYILEGEGKYDFSDEEKENAKEIMKKYRNTLGILGLLENAKFENLRLNAVEKTNKLQFEKIAKELSSANDYVNEPELKRVA